MLCYKGRERDRNKEDFEVVRMKNNIHMKAYVVTKLETEEETVVANLADQFIFDKLIAPICGDICFTQGKTLLEISDDDLNKIVRNYMNCSKDLEKGLCLYVETSFKEIKRKMKDGAVKLLITNE